MKQILKEIQSGSFAKEWMEENKKGRPNYNKMREACDKHPIEKVGTELRGMMRWIQSTQSLAANPRANLNKGKGTKAADKSKKKAKVAAR